MSKSSIYLSFSKSIHQILTFNQEEKKIQMIIIIEQNFLQLTQQLIVKKGQCSTRSISHGVQQILKMCDLFSISQFIRYKGDADYKTATGGFFSVAIFTIFSVLFTSTAIQTVDRKIINWTSETTNQLQPSATNATVNPFLITVGIMYLNINDPAIRYFDFKLTERYWQGPQEVRNNSIELIPCTQEHFSITKSLQSTFNKIPANKWLCPPIGYSFQLAGKFTSFSMSFIELSVFQCNPSLNLSRPCANSTQMQQLEAQMGQFFVNPLLNPGKQDYTDYYLQDRNYIAFTSHLGAYGNAHLQDYTVITDQSILPYSTPKQESGVIISELFQNINFEVTNKLYASLFFYKSSSSTTYNRSFYKIDQFFSYVGGLVGSIMAGMLLLNSYNQASFQISIANDIYDHKQNNYPTKFNLFYYIMLFYYSLLKKVSSKCKDWEIMRQYSTIQAEMAKQLDISFILSRIIFLERSIQVIIQSEQFEAMHLSRKLTLQQAKRLRNHYRIHRFLLFTKEKHESTPSESLNQTQNDLKNPSNQVIQEKKVQKKETSSDESQEEEMKIHLSQSIRQFQRTVQEGNKRSLQISKDILWDGIQINRKNLHEHLQQPILSLKQEVKNSDQSEQPKQDTQPLRVKSKNKGNKSKLDTFEYITFLQ